MLPRIRIHTGDLVSPIRSLTDYFREGGVSIIQAAFNHTYFVHPDAVRRETPYFPDRVRRSREHYPGLDKGESATWNAGDRRQVILDDNSHAQMAWARYTGHRLERGTGYGVRHIWGNTHNPNAFTAGWNLCYMPFWAGMLTEEQHPHPELQQAIRQASWDLFFFGNPVCEPPDFVEDPGMDLNAVLEGRPLLVLSREAREGSQPPRRSGQVSPLPIILEPANSSDFLDSLLRTKEAWLEVSYTDGRKEVRRWNAQRMRRSSNVIGNLRSRPEFRAGTWQKKDIASLRVSIERPRNAAG